MKTLLQRVYSRIMIQNFSCNIRLNVALSMGNVMFIPNKQLSLEYLSLKCLYGTLFYRYGRGMDFALLARYKNINVYVNIEQLRI